MVFSLSLSLILSDTGPRGERGRQWLQGGGSGDIGGAADWACAALAWATAHATAVAQATTGGAAARTYMIVAPVTTDEAVAQATVG
jgi:hypothetical protein